MTTFADTGLDYSTPLTINSNQRVYITETNNLKIQAVSNDAQRWEMTMTLRPIHASASDKSAAKLSRHRTVNSYHKTFTTSMPQHPGVTLSGNSSVRVIPAFSATAAYKVGDFVVQATKTYQANSNLAAGAFDATDWTEVTANIPNKAGSTRIWVSNNGQALDEGAFINTGVGKKVYQVTADFVEDTASNGSLLSIFPPLVEDVAAGNLQTNPQISVKYARDGISGVSYDQGIMVSSQVSVIEAL